MSNFTLSNFNLQGNTVVSQMAGSHNDAFQQARQLINGNPNHAAVISRSGSDYSVSLREINNSTLVHADGHDVVMFGRPV